MKKWMKLVSVAIAAVMMVSLIGCSQEGGTGKTTKLKVCEVTHSVFYAPQYVAMSKGFFAAEGLEIELSNGGGADKVMAAVLSHNIDIGLAGPEACIYVYNEGREDYPQVFAQLTKRDGSFLVSREKHDSFTWDLLNGTTVIPGRKGGVPYMTLEYVLKQKGIVPGTNVTLDDSIQFDLMAGAFTSGTADYVTLFEPVASSVEKEGKGYVVASVGEASGEIPYTAYFANQDYIRDNADTVQRFTNAVAQGQKWVQDHTAKEIAEAIADQFPDTDLSMLATAIQSYKDIDAWNATPVMSKEAFDRLQNVIIEAGELKEKVVFDQIIDNTFAEKAK